MKIYGLVFLIFVSPLALTDNFDAKKFAESYFNAWTATQAPNATKSDIELYLSYLKNDIGHQHLPYDKDDQRSSDGKEKMREGMNYYLGTHTEYTGKILNYSFGFNVIIIEYDTFSKGKRPDGELVIQKYKTLEVLEIEDDKVSVIRKYSE